MLTLNALFKELQKQGTLKPDVFLGYINAYQGKFSEAARNFKRGNEDGLAMTMFSDLRMFDLAKVRAIFLLSFQKNF